MMRQLNCNGKGSNCLNHPNSEICLETENIENFCYQTLQKFIFCGPRCQLFRINLVQWFYNWGLQSEMGSIKINVLAIRIARYFCINIGIALATFESIAYRYRLTHILRIDDTCINK